MSKRTRLAIIILFSLLSSASFGWSISIYSPRSYSNCSWKTQDAVSWCYSNTYFSSRKFRIPKQCLFYSVALSSISYLQHWSFFDSFAIKKYVRNVLGGGHESPYTNVVMNIWIESSGLSSLPVAYITALFFAVPQFVRIPCLLWWPSYLCRWLRARRYWMHG